jgi:hypothetical protein
LSNEADYVDNKLKEVVEKIESQSRLFSLNKVNIDVTCTTYLMMTEDEITKLSPEELALAEIRLASYGLTIQQHLNKAIAIKNWADRSIRLLVAKNYNSYDKYMPYDARKDAMVVSNEFGERLGQIISEQQIIVDEFAYLSQAVQHVSDAFGRFAKIRRKEV